MRYLIILFMLVTVAGASSCRVKGPARPHRAFVIPAYKTRHHYGAPRRFTLHNRYWGPKRRGLRPHPYRGMQHY